MGKNIKCICKTEIKRIAWRLQYRQRKIFRNEYSHALDHLSFSYDPSVGIFNSIFVREIIQSLSCHVERYLLIRIYLDQATEKEVALELKMSQQWVNKWKKMR
ncbi:hypothetical protein G4V62_18015 [Bacillaceae bacterium SIJ1]|uniref:hypothetical protein n=1 Tax=Litoribacterium kuwaitense TaxID=1398745 RepID=UPI0013ED4879|nr:hypothetical protein [Litoribacterium kuwaitense]NGP46747.1 hypothetical protein [Litoribacterium kuwaitense]